jgi:3-hydroxyisobutyrate dehydrogenase
MHNFPVPLSSAAEQTYLTALMLGWGARDDSAMVRMYFSDPILSVKTKHKSPEEVTNICKAIDLMKFTNICKAIDRMKFTNICAAVEAIAFAKYLRVDMDQFYDLVTGAAGNSHIFTAIGAKMIPTPELEEHMADMPRIDEIVQQFTPIIQLARDLHCPLSLGTEALNQFLFAQRRGLGSEKCTRLLSLWNPDR